jgi:anti-sigma regulatory factor (Ser/Thr protein kinase)
MAIHHSQIRAKAAEYRIELNPDRDVIFSAERPDLVDGENLNNVLASVEAELRELGTDDQAVYAVKNIILELAGNTAMHGTGRQTEPELLVVSREEKAIRIWMFGKGRKTQIERLSQIIKAIDNMAVPPEHRDILLRRRNEKLLRTSLSPSSKVYGGGTGMLTIAALSSEPLWFLPSSANRQSFLLSSTV